MIHTNIDALHERQRSSIQRIADLEETLHLAREEKCQLKRDVEAKSLELRAAESEVGVKSKPLADLELVLSFFLASSLVLMFVGEHSILGFILLPCFVLPFTFILLRARSVFFFGDFCCSHFIPLRSRNFCICDFF